MAFFSLTPGNDIFTGTVQDDVILALPGDDIIHGANGDDAIIGDIGNDQLFGDNQNDYLQGDAGNDQLTGGKQSDSVYGNAGFDSFFWFKGDGGTSDRPDFMDGGADFDVLYMPNTFSTAGDVQFIGMDASGDVTIQMLGGETIVARNIEAFQFADATLFA